MPRKLRVQYPGAIYHVMSRGGQLGLGKPKGARSNLHKWMNRQPEEDSPSETVGGGVKVVEKWRFEIPKDSWHDFRWPSVFTPCPDARRPAFGRAGEENEEGRRGLMNPWKKTPHITPEFQTARIAPLST